MANYLYIAIVFVCFFDVVIKALLPSSATYNVAPDGSNGRMIAECTALGISLITLSTIGFKKIENKWACLFVFFMLFSSFHGPNIEFHMRYLPTDPSVFNFKPMFDALIFFFLFMAIYSQRIDVKAYQNIGQTMAWTGIIYSAYIICQYFHMDQIYNLVSTDLSSLSRHPQCGGFIGQPVFASCILAMCLPFVIKYKPWLIILILLGVLATGNRSGWVAICVSMAFQLSNSKKLALGMALAYIAIIGAVMLLYWHNSSNHLNAISDGRLSQWRLALHDIFHPTFPGLNKTYILSGLGIGSFSIFFPSYHNSIFFQAHNEYLEVLYGLNIIGLFLLLRMMWDIFKTSHDKTITASLIAISIFCITNAGWHIPQLQFLTIFLIGLVYNKELNYVMGYPSTKNSPGSI